MPLKWGHFKVSGNVEIQGGTGNITGKNIYNGKEMSQMALKVKQFASVEDPLNKSRTASN